MIHVQGNCCKAASFSPRWVSLATCVHYLFQAIVSPQLGGTSGEYGLVLATLAFVGFLGLPLNIAVQAVTHYIARFHFSSDDARLHGLLGGCQKFLFHVTIAGSIIATILVKPLGDFFQHSARQPHAHRVGLRVGSLWGPTLTALCQGLGWFKRLALIGLLAAVLRVLFGGLTTSFWPVAECAVAASAVMLSANLVLLLWRKDFPQADGHRNFPMDAGICPIPRRQRRVGGWFILLHPGRSAGGQ